MHAVFTWEDGLVVGVDVVDGEGDELAAAPEDLPEEVVGVEGVGESHREQHEDDAVPVAGLVDVVHGLRARWEAEVGIAGVEEGAGELDRPPPPRHRPHAEGVLHEHARRVAPLRHDRRAGEGGSVVLHLAAADEGEDEDEGEEVDRIWWERMDLGWVVRRVERPYK